MFKFLCIGGIFVLMFIFALSRAGGAEIYIIDNNDCVPGGTVDPVTGDTSWIFGCHFEYPKLGIALKERIGEGESEEDKCQTTYGIENGIAQTRVCNLTELSIMLYYLSFANIY